MPGPPKTGPGSGQVEFPLHTHTRTHLEVGCRNLPNSDKPLGQLPTCLRGAKAGPPGFGFHETDGGLHVRVPSGCVVKH